jgi:catechol 2,3-dioxygenase-like lactoylglutathione lyase family enzyme
MLGDKTVIPTLAVSDMERARDFYENTLGLKQAPGLPEGADMGAIVYQSGSSAVLVYLSAYAGTNKATAAAWGVGDDFDAIVEDLKSKGVTFERYDDLPDTTREGDVHVTGEMRSVWFKDPDGNILNVGNVSM